MKNKILIFFGLILLVFAFVGCKEKDEEPVFAGLEDKEILKGSTFNALEGVTVTDKEDGTIDVSAVSVDLTGFNPNVEGEYTITYSVTDSYGHTVTASRKIKVVYNDTEKPVFYGVQNKSIIVGDETYTHLSGVTAVDNIDDDVTEDIVASGTVDIWTPGEYTVNYEVEDSAGNKQTASRTITVGIGDAIFSDENLLGEAYTVNVADTAAEQKIEGISGGHISETYADYTLVKVVITASSTVAKAMTMSINGATSSSAAITIGTESAEYVKYFRISAPLENATLTMSFAAGTAVVSITETELYFASFEDIVAPEVSIADNADVYVPVDAPEAVVRAELLRNVQAQDNLDGVLTSSLDIDLLDANLSVAGEYTVKVYVEDRAGNVGELERTLVVAQARDMHFFPDPEFNGELGDYIKLSTGAGGQTSLAIVDGVLKYEVIKAGGWASGDSPYLNGLTTDLLTSGYYYMLKFDVKADMARNIIIRAGHELLEEPWIEDFAVGRPKYALTTDFQTVYYIFYVSKATSSIGSKTIKFEIQCGSIDWANEDNNNIYFDNMQIYKLTNVNEKPVITQAENVKTTYTLGDDLPDLASFITATDLEDGPITITSAMINDGGLDMNVAGTYTVVYTVTDSNGASSTHEIIINVIEEEDTIGPVITIAPEALAYLEANQPDQGTDLTGVVAILADFITITDNVDGNITFNINMVNLDGLNLTNPAPGTYHLVIKTKDSSGNDSNTVELELVVKDAQPPKFLMAGPVVLYVGDTYNPFLGVMINDNVDGLSEITLDNITGLEQFMNAQGEVTTAGTFQVTYTATDAAGNEGTKTIAIEVKENPVNFDDSTYLDIVPKISWLSAGGSGSTKENTPEGGVIVNFKPSSDGWASAVHLKCDRNINLVSGETYKLVIEAKAELPREIAIMFKNGDGEVITGFQTGSNARLLLGVMDDFYVYEFVFTVENSNASNCTFEVHLNYDYGFNEINTRVEQQIEFKQLRLYSTAGVLPPLNLPETVIYNDFEGYEDNEAYQAASDDNIVGTRIGSGDFVKNKGELIVVNGNKLLVQNFDGAVGNTHGIRFKISKDDIPSNIQYIAIWMKASSIDNYQATTPIRVFCYDSSNSNSEITESIIGSKEALLDGTFIYIPVSQLKSTTVQVSVIIYVQASASGVLYFDDLLLVKNTLTDYGHVVLEDFENYDAEDTVVVGNRIGGSNFLKENGAIVGEDNKVLKQNFTYNTNGTNGLRFKISLEDIPLGVKYIAVYMKVSDISKVQEFKAFRYTSSNANTDISNKLIAEKAKLTNGCYVYLPISALAADTVEVCIMINVNSGATGELIYDDLMLRKDFVPASAPVVSISDEHLAELSRSTLKAGESLLPLLDVLLSMIDINDPEDGQIAATAAMCDFGNLDPSNPAMGLYNVKIKAVDSDGNESNELIVPLSILTVLNDFEDYADDEEFKADPVFIGFRVSGGNFVLENGSLVVGENQKLQQDSGTGLNGIKFNITKAALTALGAEYFGIRIKTSAEVSAIRAFGYPESGNHEINTVIGSKDNLANGTYVFIPVSALNNEDTSVSIQINVTGGSGSIYYDNFVIR